MCSATIIGPSVIGYSTTIGKTTGTGELIINEITSFEIGLKGTVNQISTGVINKVTVYKV